MQILRMIDQRRKQTRINEESRVSRGVTDVDDEEVEFCEVVARPPKKKRRAQKGWNLTVDGPNPTRKTAGRMVLD